MPPIRSLGREVGTSLFNDETIDTADEEQTVPVREPDTTTHFQYDQLMSQRRVLCVKSAL